MVNCLIANIEKFSIIQSAIYKTVRIFSKLCNQSIIVINFIKLSFIVFFLDDEIHKKVTKPYLLIHVNKYLVK